MNQAKSCIRATGECQVSVVICTYNRPNVLVGVLETLQTQVDVDRIEWEIVIVDNDPDLSAKLVYDRIRDTGQLRIRYVSERKIGLSHARNRAICESNGEIVVFLDDDVLVGPHWLAEILGTFERTGADCVGGRVMVKWEGTPEPVVRACEKELVAFDKGDRDFRFAGREGPIGANLALRASLFVDQTAFSPELGRSEGNLMGCEEIELLLRLGRQRRAIWYSAGAAVLHRTDGERLGSAYYRRREYWNGVSLAVVDGLQNSWGVCQLKAWLRLVQVIVMLLPKWCLAAIRRDSRGKFLNECLWIKYTGYWRGTLGIGGNPGRSLLKR